MDQKRNLKIEEMKKEYESYAAPNEALERTRAGIAQAEKEEKMIRFGKTAGITAAAAMAAVVLLANSGENVAKAMEQIPVIGTITKVVTFRNYSDNSGGFEANVDIPQIVDNENHENTLGINKTIEEYAEQLISMYEQDLQQSGGEGYYMLDSSYEVIRDDDHYLCIRINSAVVMAGTNQFVKIFNIDKNTGGILTLADLFGDTPDYAAVISENIKEQMREQMAADEMIAYFIYSEEEPYGFDTITDESHFYLNENNELVIVFDEYEAAPGYMGVVEFTIPKEVLTFAESE